MDDFRNVAASHVTEVMVRACAVHGAWLATI